MVAGLFRFIFILVLTYIVYLFIRIWRGLKRSQKRAAPPRSIRGVMVKDEICNTYIPREEALREVRDGREHFFCSEECRKKFLSS
jgi:YHS domain-containing protein